MTIKEIFTSLAAHMEKGIATHQEFFKIYNFLCLKGYKKCHYYHFLEELQSYHYLLHYYMDHYHELLKIPVQTDLQIIPQSWYKYNQFQIDTNTKCNTVKNVMKQWIDWEKSTKELFSKLYQEAYNLGEIAAAKEISCLLYDVDKELKDAEKKFLKLEASNYDIVYILDEQKDMYCKYKNKIKHLFKES